MIKVIPHALISVLVKIESDEYWHSYKPNNYFNLIVLDITHKIIDLSYIEEYIHVASLYSLIKHTFKYHAIKDNRAIKVIYPIRYSHIITNDGEALPIELNDGWTFINPERIYYPIFKEINNIKTPSDSFEIIKEIFA